MQNLLIKNSKNGKQIIYQVKHNFDLQNKTLVDAILKSVSGVYKEQFDKVYFA